MHQALLFDNFRFPDGPEVTDADITDSDTDSCIYVLARQAGEGGDRKVEPGDFLLTDCEKETIKFLSEKYEKFVLAINCGSAMDMNFLSEIPGINAILYICQLGTEGGHAFADIISGEVAPSGKLTSTWAKKYVDVPYAMEFGALNGNLKDEYYKEGIYVGYRYYDSFGVEPAYPFGYGLSYTTFAWSDFSMTEKDGDFEVSVTVTNTGNWAGKDVVQIYAQAPYLGTVEKSSVVLVGFAKTENLKPGASQTVTITVSKKDLISYDRNANGGSGGYILDAGNYYIAAASNAHEALNHILLEQINLNVV